MPPDGGSEARVMTKLTVALSAIEREASVRSMPRAAPAGPMLGSTLLPQSPSTSVATTTGLAAAEAPVGTTNAAARAAVSASPTSVLPFMVSPSMDVCREDSVRRWSGGSCYPLDRTDRQEWPHPWRTHPKRTKTSPRGANPDEDQGTFGTLRSARGGRSGRPAERPRHNQDLRQEPLRLHRPQKRSQAQDHGSRDHLRTRRVRRQVPLPAQRAAQQRSRGPVPR